MTDPTPLVKPAALLLDLDGTLVDSNYQHVLAWSRAFADARVPVSCAQLHRCIGLPSADLVRDVLGREDDGIVRRHAQHWASLRDGVQALPGATPLLQAAHRAGLRLVAVTSAGPDDVAFLLDRLQAAELFHAVLGPDEVPRGKPAPDGMLAGLAEAGTSPEETLAVGDSVYDLHAARAAGVPGVGLLSGGTSRAELLEAGAKAVHEDPAALLATLEEHG